MSRVITITDGIKNIEFKELPSKELIRQNFPNAEFVKKVISWTKTRHSENAKTTNKKAMRKSKTIWLR